MASLKVKELLCLLYSALLFISGLLLIGFSVVLTYNIFYHFKFIPSSSIGPFIVFFLLGFIHLFLTWLGIKGPTREHDLHIILFIIITVILLAAECALGVWSIILWDEVDVESLQLMMKSFNELLDHGFYKQEWASLESKLQCCGLDGVEAYKLKKNFIPVSCCDIGILNATCPEVFNTGCKKPLARYIKRILIDGVIMGFSCCILQAIGVIAFYTFFKSLKAERSARIQRRLELQRRISQENGGSHPTSATAPPVTPATSA